MELFYLLAINDNWPTSLGSEKLFFKNLKKNPVKQYCESYAKTIIHHSVGE